MGGNNTRFALCLDLAPYCQGAYVLNAILASISQTQGTWQLIACIACDCIPACSDNSSPHNSIADEQDEQVRALFFGGRQFLASAFSRRQQWCATQSTRMLHEAMAESYQTSCLHQKSPQNAFVDPMELELLSIKHPELMKEALQVYRDLAQASHLPTYVPLAVHLNTLHWIMLLIMLSHPASCLFAVLACLHL
eukprot:scaffold70372_cov18-Tisochrysis_lutea.AAC.1